MFLRLVAACGALFAFALVPAVAIVAPASAAAGSPHASQALRPWGTPAAPSVLARTSLPSWAPRPRTASVQHDLETTNWAGVIDEGAQFTGVSAQWTVPTVTPAGSDTYSSTWVGVDGGAPGDGNLIQTGTEQDASGSVTGYYAWYEILPALSVPIGGVTPGDLMNVSVDELDPGTWEISIADETSDQSFVQDFSYDGAGETAEWIEEAPTLGTSQTTLSDFGTVQFTHMAVTGSGLGSVVAEPTEMVNENTLAVEAFPVAIDAAGGTLTIDYGPPGPPRVVSLIPSTGPPAGGTTVTIYGTHFTNVTAVDFGTTGVQFTLEPGALVVKSPHGSTGATADVRVVTIEGTSAVTTADRFTYVAPAPPPPPPPPHGYWLVGADGGIFTFGQAHFYGSTGALRLQRPVVGITPTPDRRGYWLAATDGGIFAFGDAGFHGSIPGLGIAPAGSPGSGRKLAAPIVGMVPSADGGGYFMVASDGGVFAFGDAHFSGSCGNIGGCAGAAVSVMPDATGKGYWLVTRLGNVYAFGDAHNFGGVPSPASPPVTAAVRTPDGRGYFVLLANGGVYPFGDARYLGAPAASGVALGGYDPATAIFATNDGAGYFVVTAAGAAYPFGNAVNQGDMNGRPLNSPIIAATGW